MRRFERHVLGIDEGTEILFSDFEHDGPMWAGTGARATLKSVRFSEPFLTPPSVHVAVAMWDVSNSSPARLDVAAEHITTEGFSAVVRTWSDTRVARVRVTWRAIGELKHEEDWTL